MKNFHRINSVFIEWSFEQPQNNDEPCIPVEVLPFLEKTLPAVRHEYRIHPANGDAQQRFLQRPPAAAAVLFCLQKFIEVIDSTDCNHCNLVRSDQTGMFPPYFDRS